MTIVLFKPTLNEKGALVARNVAKRIPERRLIICKSVAQLRLTLSQLYVQDVLIVLLAETREHLSALYSSLDLLQLYRNIIVLPDGDETTVSLGHKFHPRFVTTLDAPPEDVGAVVAKMLQGLSSHPCMGSAADD